MSEYKLMKENGAYVRKMLKKRKYDDASLTGWGRLDELVTVMAAFKTFDILSKMKVNLKDEDCPIPRWFSNLGIINNLSGKPIFDSQFSICNHHILLTCYTSNW